MANYINKDDLLNFIEILNFDERMTKEYLIGVIESEELADVKPIVIGEWIRVTNGRGGHECSNCHEYAPSYSSGKEWLSEFCPNCGADMRKEREEEE